MVHRTIETKQMYFTVHHTLLLTGYKKPRLFQRKILSGSAPQPFYRLFVERKCTFQISNEDFHDQSYYFASNSGRGSLFPEIGFCQEGLEEWKNLLDITARNK